MNKFTDIKVSTLIAVLISVDHSRDAPLNVSTQFGLSPCGLSISKALYGLSIAVQIEILPNYKPYAFYDQLSGHDITHMQATVIFQLGFAYEDVVH